MYNHDKQTKKNPKLHRHWAQGVRKTPLWNSLQQQQQKKVETNLCNAILNSNISNNDINNNTSHNNSNGNDNNKIITTIIIKLRNMKPKDTNSKYY